MTEDEKICYVENFRREILRRAIEKAEKNGFDNRNITCFDTHDIPSRLYVRFLMCEEFAKAFWGEELCSDIDGEVLDNIIWEENDIHCTRLWKFYLQQMVLEEEPLKYLERFLDK